MWYTFLLSTGITGDSIATGSRFAKCADLTPCAEALWVWQSALGLDDGEGSGRVWDFALACIQSACVLESAWAEVRLECFGLWVMAMC